MGERRIGVAFADGTVAIAVPLLTIPVDGTERRFISELCAERHITDVVVGRPRNQSGAPTAQTAWVETKVHELLAGIDVTVHFQDESLTSAVAEARLKASTRSYERADIDREAATIILQDFLDGRQKG